MPVCAQCAGLRATGGIPHRARHHQGAVKGAQQQQCGVAGLLAAASRQCGAQVLDVALDLLAELRLQLGALACRIPRQRRNGASGRAAIAVCFIEVEVQESVDVRLVPVEQVPMHRLAALLERQFQRFPHEFVPGGKVLVKAAVGELQVLHQVREADAVDAPLLESCGGALHQSRVGVCLAGFRVSHGHAV